MNPFGFRSVAKQFCGVGKLSKGAVLVAFKAATTIRTELSTAQRFFRGVLRKMGATDPARNEICRGQGPEDARYPGGMLRVDPGAPRGARRTPVLNLSREPAAPAAPAFFQHCHTPGGDGTHYYWICVLVCGECVY